MAASRGLRPPGRPADGRAGVARRLGRLVVRAALRCAGVLRGAARHARPRPLPRSRPTDGGARTSRRVPAGTMVLETEHETTYGARPGRRLPRARPLPSAARSARRGSRRAGRHGGRARRALRLRLDRPLGAPCRRPLARDRRARTASSCARRCDLHGRGQTSVGRVHRRRRRAGPVRARLVSVATTRARSPTTPASSSSTRRRTWQNWSARCSDYSGEWREPVLRSLLTLEALTYEPTGGIVAAPTTSLPEAIGGTRNWDYRYCWVRDATLTLEAFMIGGYQSEALRWREWLLRAAAGDPKTLQTMYGVGGERRLTELELDWLPGYEGSRPVRTGNGAHSQLPARRVRRAARRAVAGGTRRHARRAPNSWSLARLLLDVARGALARARRGHLGSARRRAGTSRIRRCCAGSRSTARSRWSSRPATTVRSTAGARSATRSTPRCARKGYDERSRRVHAELRRPASSTPRC